MSDWNCRGDGPEQFPQDIVCRKCLFGVCGQDAKGKGTTYLLDLWNTRADTAGLAALRAERDALFLQLGGLQSCIAEELGTEKTPLDDADARPILTALRDRAERAESDAAESKRNRLPLDETTRFILGRPNFVVCPIAHRLRELGHEIKRKCEDEQAYAIHWLLQLYLEHGSAWKDKANELLFQKTAALTPEASK